MRWLLARLMRTVADWCFTAIFYTIATPDFLAMWLEDRWRGKPRAPERRRFGPFGGRSYDEP